MKKHILLLGIFLSLTVFLSVQAGNTVIDSLKQEIRQAERAHILFFVYLSAMNLCITLI